MTSPSPEFSPNPKRSTESVEGSVEKDSLNYKERMSKDPAAKVLEAAYYLRRAYFAYNVEQHRDAGHGDSQSINEANQSLTSAFAEDGDMEGGYELIQLRDKLRAEKRGPNKSEKRFLSYVNSVESYYKAHSELELTSVGGLQTDENETTQQKIDRTIHDNQEALDDLDGDNSDEAEEARIELKKDIKALEYYKDTLDKDSILSDDSWSVSEYLENQRSADSNKALGRHAWEYRAVARAMNLLATSGYASAKSINVQRLKRAPELEPVAIPSDTQTTPKEQIVERKQNQKFEQQTPQKVTRIEPKSEPKLQTEPKPQSQSSENSSIKKDPDHLTNEQSKARRKEALGRTILKLYGGSGTIDGKKFHREGVRNELAREKSKIFQNWLIKKEIGRTALGLFGIDTAKRQQKIHGLEEKFIRLADKKFGLENYDAIKSGDLDDDEKMEQLQNANEIEMNALRAKTSEHMRNTLVARFCKAVGTFEWRNNKNKAAWIFGGVAVAAASIATGGMLPVMMASSTLAAARLDKKIRGMPSATKRTSSVELQNEIKADYRSEMLKLRDAEKLMQKAKRKFDKNIAAGMTEKEAKKKFNKATAGNILKAGNEVTSYPYRIGLRAAMRRFDKDMNWEVGKRLGILGGMGAVAVGGSYLGSAIAGIDSGNWIGRSPVTDAWHDFAGPARFNPSEWPSIDMTNPETYNYIAQNYRITGN